MPAWFPQFSYFNSVDSIAARTSGDRNDLANEIIESVPTPRRPGMRRRLAESVVAFLSFTNPSTDSLKEFGHRDWDRALKWMDDAGLSFYFLQRLKETEARHLVPMRVVSRLEENYHANQQRMDHMSNYFDSLNRKFKDAGIRYAVIKGFSLVPQFCPFAALRHQSDLDYLVEEPSLADAKRIVADAGYKPKDSWSKLESIFVMNGEESPSRDSRQFSKQAPHAVELHLDIWDADLHKWPSIPRLFSVDRVVTQRWNEKEFSALADEEAFLLQVLHACHHFFTLWIRMSCLYEIAYFLNRRANDSALWDRLEKRVGENAVLREFVVVVSQMAASLFGTPVPPLISRWREQMRAGPRVWVDKYARRWAFCEVPAYEFSLFPTAKLALFLHQQYRNEEIPPKATVRYSKPPSLRLARIISSLKANPSLFWNVAWWKHHLLLRRGAFQALSGLRYLCEIPRWRWLNRTSSRGAPLEI